MSPTVNAEDGGVTLFGTPVSDMQSDVVVSGDAITGTLKYLDSGDLVDAWGEGNFLCLKFEDFDPNATSVLVGLEPSYGNGLVDILPDPDHDGAWKITDKDNQVFRVVTSDGTNTVTKDYTLSGLILETA